MTTTATIPPKFAPRSKPRAAAAYDRLLVLFQPHRFTRTKHLWDDFCRAFNQADVLVITDIYAASEQPIPGITSEALADAIRAAGHKNVVYRGTLQDGIEYRCSRKRARATPFSPSARATLAAPSASWPFCSAQECSTAMRLD